MKRASLLTRCPFFFIDPSVIRCPVNRVIQLSQTFLSFMLERRYWKGGQVRGSTVHNK